MTIQFFFNFKSFIFFFGFLIRKFGHDVNEDIKIQKHKVIAQTWAKRKEFQDKGRLSISFYNTHTDPVGLNFNVNDLNSTGTNDISSTWANYLPNVVKRRFALTGATTNSSSCGPRKSSLDSNKISISVKRVSVESISRRNSVDSQVSLKISEMQTKVARRTTSGGHHHHTVKGKTSARNRRRDFHHTSSTANHRFNRRESSTSVESQVITAAVKKTSYPQSNKLSTFFPTKDPTCMKRRSASAGIVDADDINTFLTNGKLILPFLHNQGMTTTSDDDNISRTSVKVQDSRLNVVVRNRDHHHISDDEDDDDDDDVDDDDINDSEQMMHHCANYQQKYIQTNHITTDNKSFGYPSLQEILAKTCSGSSSVNYTAELKQNALKNSKEGGGGRNSKNSLKSIRSRKSSRQSTRRNRKNSSKNVQPPKIITKKDSATTTENFAATADDSSFASFSSGLEIPMGTGGGTGGNIQSSYSGLSIGKTHSRGSKTSCDVGIQANAYEIATQTMPFDSGDLNNIHNHRDSIRTTTATVKINNDNINDDDDDDVFNDGAGENHQLLPSSAPVTIRKREQSIGTTTSMIRRDTLAMSESEKLKMLLLPSK